MQTEESSVIDVIANLPPNHVYLSTPGLRGDARELLSLVVSIRETFVSFGGQPVALISDHLPTTIVCFLALSGFVAELYLLPQEHLGPTVFADLGKLTQHQVHCTQELLQNIFGNSKHDEPPRQITDELDTRIYIRSSGTTGAPKWYDHTIKTLTRTVPGKSHRSLVWGFPYEPFRFIGLQVILHSLYLCHTLVLPEGRDFESQIQSYLQGNVDSLSATPTYWRKLLWDPRCRELKLKQITLGGEIADQTILDALRKMFPEARILHIYASTEAGVGFSVSDLRAGFPASFLKEGHKNLRLRINSDGILEIYSGDLQQLRARENGSLMTEDGYLISGDAVEISGDRVHFQGRSATVINVGGNKVRCEEVEACVRQLDFVQEAKAFAKKSTIMGFVVALDVQCIPNKTLEPELIKKAIRQHCVSRLTPYKIPMEINIKEEISFAPTGKLDRKSIETNA